MSSDLSDTQIENNPFGEFRQESHAEISPWELAVRNLAVRPGMQYVCRLLDARTGMGIVELWRRFYVSKVFRLRPIVRRARLESPKRTFRRASMDGSVIERCVREWGNTNANAVLEAKLLNKSSSLDKDISAG